LGDDAFLAGLADVAEDFAAVADDMLAVADRRTLRQRGDELLELLLAVDLRAIAPVGAVELEKIEGMAEQRAARFQRLLQCREGRMAGRPVGGDDFAID